MTTIAPSRILSRLLASPAGQTVADDILGEDRAERRRLAQSIADRRVAYESDGPRLFAEIEAAKALIPDARKTLRGALAKYSAAQQHRARTLEGHTLAIAEAEDALRRLTPPFLAAAIQHQNLQLREIESNDDGTTGRFQRREAAKWALAELAKLALSPDPTPEDVATIERQALAVGRLRFGITRVSQCRLNAYRYPLDETKGLRPFAEGCTTTLGALQRLDPASPTLDRDLDRLRVKFRRLTPATFRDETW